MRPVLLALHGYTMNGTLMQSACEGLVAPLLEHADILFPDAPHACDPVAVEAAYTAWRVAPPPPPHRTWWRASDDGRTYEGWEVSRERLREVALERAPLGVLGFSQGAMVAATLAALASRGAFPALRFAVLVAGAPPRADALRPLFGASIPVPSLHVWGERDRRASATSPLLMEAFDPHTRERVTWHGPHVVPPAGETAQAIASFVLRQFGTHAGRSA